MERTFMGLSETVIPRIAVSQEAFGGMVPCHDFTQALAAALRCLTKRPDVWEGEGITLYFPDPGIGVAELDFAEPVPVNGGGTKVLGFDARFCTEVDLNVYLGKEERVALWIGRRDTAECWWIDGPVKRAPRDLRGPTQTVRLGIRRAALAV